MRREKSEAAFRKASITHMRYNDVIQCPNKIMYHGHYNTDGSCRCFDQFHYFMIDWGFEWDREKLIWKHKPEGDK